METAQNWANAQVNIVPINVFQREGAMFVVLSRVLLKDVIYYQHLQSVMQIQQLLEFKIQHLEKLHNVLLAKNLVTLMKCFV